MSLLSCSDMFLQRTNKLGGHHLKKIKSRAAVAVLRLVQSEEDRAELVSRLEFMSEGERQATAVIITREVPRYQLARKPLKIQFIFFCKPFTQ